MNGPLIQARNIELNLHDKPILQQVDLMINPAEIVTLIGPNGAGKTTLLRVVLGLQRPDRGEVVRAAGLRIGYMPQRMPLDLAFPINVKRFLLLAGSVSQTDIAQVLSEVGAEKLLESPLQTLSGGEFQRILLARALLRNPALLVLDEPVQGVDVHGQIEIFKLLTRIREQRACAILMVSHDLHLVMASTDRVICLNRHICCTGNPEAVTRNPEFLAMFGAAAVQSLAIYSHDQEHRHEQCHHGDHI
jgi:zinc transport system ATP-binding protein